MRSGQDPTHAHPHSKDDEKVAEAAQPPSANRGVVTHNGADFRPLRIQSLLSSESAMAGVDYLTFTTSTRGGRALAASPGFEFVEEGSPQRGFASSEKWAAPGGVVWRKKEPAFPSKMFGRSYETWEASGAASAALAVSAEPLEGRPSRLDVAFDFAVSEGDLADHVAEAIADVVKRRRLSQGISGEDGRNTCYVGAVTSDRRVRIYRRDFKDESLREMGLPPLLRIELVLKNRYARALWGWLKVSREKMLGGAAAHIRDMTGLDVIQGVSSMPELESPPDDVRGSQKVVTWVRQHAVMLQAVSEVGIDVATLARIDAERKGGAVGRKHISRLRAARIALQGVTFETCRLLMMGIAEARAE